MLVYYKQERLLHQSILNDYADANADTAVTVKRAGANQIVIKTEETDPQPITTSEELMEFLKHSARYRDAMDCPLLG
jgi:hypothetical protein